MARKIKTIDAHTAGEPLRIITEGWPEIPGKTILEKRRFAREHHDDLRRALMWEPRGHADMYGAIPTEPVTSDGDVGVLFLHNEGWSTMCGHGIIGLVKVGIEEKLFESGDTVRIDTPAGRVTATAHRKGDRVETVSFLNVPSFVLREEEEYTIAFGGAFYAYVNTDQPLVPERFRDLIDEGMRIKRKVVMSTSIEHPDHPDLGFLYGTILIGPSERHHSRNVCIFADGEVDRCPTGTGVSGRAAIHHARGELRTGETITIESLIGTTFDVSVAETTTVGDFPAVVPEVTGAAHITGRHEFVIDPDDPLRDGFLLR